MIKQIYSHSKVSKAVWILFFTLLSGFLVNANPLADTTKKKLLAAVSAKENAGFITLEPNVVFPEILTGNEAETLAYIEKFSEKNKGFFLQKPLPLTY